MKLSRRIFLAALALLIVGGLAWAWRPAPVPVSVALIGQGPLQVTVEEDGQTRIQERYTVTPPVTGYVPRIALHIGDAVQAGDTLFMLEPLPPAALDVRTRAEAQAGVLRARAALAAAKNGAQAADASAAFASREIGRLQPLFENGTVSKTQYDQALAEAERSEAALQSAKAAIDVARYELAAAETALRYSAGERSKERITVVSPIAGAVLAVHREDEGVAAAGQPMVTVGDPRSLEIVVDVLSADAVRIRPDMTVWLERWGGEAALEAKVRTVEPTAFTKISALGVEEQRVRVIADLVSPPGQWAALGDGYRVEARFVLWESADALRVPHSSLFRAGDRWVVFVVQDGRARRRPVKTGERGVLYAQVLEGLEEGETVITYPDDRLADDARVTVRETEAP